MRSLGRELTKIHVSSVALLAMCGMQCGMHQDAWPRYALGENVFVAPYDWRLAGDSHAKPTNGVGGFYEELKKLIEDAVQVALALA